MRLLSLSAVDICHKPHKLIYSWLGIMPRSSQTSQAFAFEAHDSLPVIDESDLDWKPTRCGPQFPLISVVLQAGVQNKYGRNASDLRP